ncbi:MAG TPA: DNA repair protein RecO [Tepidisphaeraceae bacterium]|nr:DNA repair protein RecO [Tepidisphaeraceae bacterium]
MPLVSDRSICLRKHEYSETSQILTLFGRTHGMIRVIAKGAHRRTKAGASKFDGGIDLLDLGDSVFTHDPNRDLATLTEWHLADGYLELRKNLRPMYLGLYAAELVSLLIEEHDPHPELFDLLQRTLGSLASDKVEEIFLAFELEMLRQTGYLPQLETCASCGQSIESASGFSPGQGGIICDSCQSSDRLPIDPRLVRLMRSILRLLPDTSRLPKLTRHQTDPINFILMQHVQHTLGRALMMRHYVAARESKQ